MIIKERIKELRAKRGLTQKELAEHFGMTREVISAYENGHTQPSLDMLIKLADFFGVSTDYLIGRENVFRFENKRRSVSHTLCQHCPKNGVTCLESDDTCLPLEMFVQLCKEPRTMAKLEYIDNVTDLLDLENSF